MDIIYVGTLPPHQGGTAVMAYQLLEALGRRGHHIRAIAPIASADIGTEPLAHFRQGGIAIHRFEMPFLETDPFSPAAVDYRDRQTEQVLTCLQALTACRRPDIVLVGRTSFLRGIPEFAGALDIPAVAWVHNAAKEEERREISAPVGSALRELRRMDRIVVCAEHVGVDWHAMGFGGADCVVNGVDLSLFQPRAPDEALRSSLMIEPTARIAIHVSNLKPVKRPLDIVRCAGALRHRCPELVWLVVGDGTGRDEMVAEAERLGVLDRLRFTGWVDHRDVVRYLNIADVAVLPSQIEAMAQAYLEAMACAVPLAVSDIAAAREALDNGTTGLLHPVGDIAGMAEAVAALLADDDLRARMTARARRDVQARFGFDRCTARFVEILSDVVQCKSRRRSGRIDAAFLGAR